MPCSTIWVRTRLGSASSLSTLFTATTIGTFAAFAWSSASSVWGITPSSAATTRTAISVTLAPRARIAVNASWPGVSMNVISRSPDVRLVRADVLRDAAELAGHDVGGADRVQQLRLAVVDVAHDRDHRGARLQLGLVDDLGFLLGLQLVLEADDVGRVAELGRDQFDRLVVQRGGRRHHLAGQEQDLHDLRRRAVRLLRRSSAAWRRGSPAAPARWGRRAPRRDAAEAWPPSAPRPFAGSSATTARAPSRRGRCAGLPASAPSWPWAWPWAWACGGAAAARGPRAAWRRRGRLPAGCAQAGNDVLGHARGGGLAGHAHRAERPPAAPCW